MGPIAAELDLASLRLGAGEGRRLELRVPVEGLELGGERYEARPDFIFDNLLEASRFLTEQNAIVATL